MRNVILIGLSGAGKTTLGQLLAKKLHLPFLDLDHWVEEKTGLSIKRIFRGYGEDFFRQLEADALKRACATDGVVAATGGGAVLNPANVRLMRESGVVILIDRPVDAILGSIAFDDRPLLRDGGSDLRRLDGQRRVLYRESAHLTLMNDGDLDRAVNDLEAMAGAALLQEGFAVIGSPIGHTLSPPIHHAVFGALQIDEPYAALHVAKGSLPAFLAGARHSGIKGFNATIPHKQDILPLLDEIDGDANLCGAVNTVIRRNGRLRGYNTDMDGLLLALNKRGTGYRGNRLLLLGAGGAAVGIACKAAKEDASRITILSRRPEQANAIKAIAAKAGSCPVLTACLDQDTLTSLAAETDLLINATPLGMHGVAEDFPSFDFLERLPGHATVIDLIYNPACTGLLLAADRLGLQTINGLDMLIYQALLGDELFLNAPIDKDQLYPLVRDALKKEKVLEGSR